MYCLQKANISPEEVDILAVSWNPSLFVNSKYDLSFVNRFLEHKYWNNRLCPQIQYVDHHIAHAASSYFLTPVERAVALVIDGHGENASTSIGLCEGNRIKFDTILPIAFSLGHFYDSVCGYIGLGYYSPGKMTGLASYGKNQHMFDSYFKWTDDGYSMDLIGEIDSLTSFKDIKNSWNQILLSQVGVFNNEVIKYDKKYFSVEKSLYNFNYAADIAASAQGILEDTIIHIIKSAFKKYDTQNLIIAGGVALNCTANGKIISKLTPKSTFICPAASDAGGALGAALYVWGQKIDNFTPYLGPEVSDGFIKMLLDDYGIKYSFFDDVNKEIINELSRGKVIGLMRGSAEIGPRALGNRSIIALPTNTQIRDRVNDIKCRERWRPLSPSMAIENHGFVLEKMRDSKYMLEAHQVRRECKEIIPGIVHIDNSCRPQTVSEEDNPQYHDLLKRVYDELGIPAILNTSFNGAREPMILTLDDALKTFYTSGIDSLVVGSFMINKNK